MKLLNKSVLFGLFFCATNVVNAQNWDIEYLDKVNSSYTESGGKVFSVLTHSITPVSVAIPIGSWVYGWKKEDDYAKWAGYEMAVNMGVNGLLTTALKLGFHKPRPFVTYPDLIEKYTHGGSYSLPSGHTAMAFSTATSLSLLYPKWYVVAPSFVWATGVAYSRMYLGVHYPTDVLLGMAVGSASAFGTHYLFKYIKKKYGKGKREVAFL